MTKFFLACLILFLLYLLCLRGRKNHPGLEKLRGWNYAHRGLHDASKPENSLSAFRAAVEHGYGAEFDVHLMADGELAVIHDASLKRTAGADVKIEDLTAPELQNYHLEGTGETIPLFKDVLEVFAGKTPLIIELKPERGNHAALTKKVCEVLDSYTGVYCLESFDPRCIYWLKKNRPDLIRGQLAENYFRTNSKLPWYLKLILSFHLEYFLTRPDFVAYHFHHRKNLSNWIVRKFLGIQGVLWTLRNEQEQKACMDEGWISIFENYLP